MSNILSKIQDKLSNVPSLYFLAVSIFGVISIITYFISNILTLPFMIIATISTFIAMWYVNILGSLKENISDMQESIDDLKKNNDHLHSELKSLEELRINLEEYAKTNKADFSKILGDVNSSFDKLEKITMANERTLMYRIAQDLEFLDQKEGMSKIEYERFVQRIPKHLKDSFVALQDTTFDAVAGDDKKLDYKEVESLVTSIVDKKA